MGPLLTQGIPQGENRVGCILTASPIPDFANSVSTTNSRVSIRLVSTAIALVASAMLLGAGVYESVVVAPNFHGAPASLQHARGFYSCDEPRHALQGIVSRSATLPPAGVAMRLAAGCCGPLEACCRAGARHCLRPDYFAFHYPRNTILFSAPSYAGRFRSLATEWGHGELRSHRRGFDPGYLGDRVPGPYLPRYRSSPEQWGARPYLGV